MEGFSYFNLFETKGIEYLAILAFFALLVPFWIILNRKVKVKRQYSRAMGILSDEVLKIPQGLFYSRNHTWAHLERSGSARIGLDDLLLHITGEVSFTRLRNPGTRLRKGDLLAVIEHQGKPLSIYSPVSGTLLANNPLLTDDPGALNEDPYRKGWICSVKPENWVADTASCYLASEASKWAAGELSRFRDFLARSVQRHAPEPAMVVLQDGGEIADQALAAMPRETWDDFQREFLDPGVEK